jgi:sarcosine oxidase subunit gamma
MLAPLSGDEKPTARLDGAWSMDQALGCYRLPRADSHAWLLVAGADAPAMLAKLCAVDLRPRAFANHAVAQTVLARIGAIVVRDDLGAALSYHLLCDSASVEYLWDCLLDAAAEFEGATVSLDALRTVAGQ